MKVLEVRDIQKTFGDFTAVDNLAFSIDEGVIFGLLGPNGAGKTTTIRMIMNIIIPDSGSVAILGHTDPRKANDFIGYLPEERGIYRKMKITELLYFMAELKRMPKREAKESADYWLERVDLIDWKKKKVEELSKGMQQKLQFVTTLLHKPRLLILDEPFGGLDPINQNLIKDILLDLKKDGTTIIFSTHVMESAEKLCEEIFLINEGKQVLYGKLSEIKKGFGRMNIHMVYEGSDDFLKTSDQIQKYNNYGNYVEVQLVKDADTQRLLKSAVQSVKIQKFEIMEPSLHDIFIESVQDVHGGGRGHV